jgi:sigma-54 specific flagellar transcriptional regulator A
LVDDEPAADDTVPATIAASADVGIEIDRAVSLPDAGLDLKAYLYSIEQKLIQEALARSGGTVSQAARLLGLRRTTLVEKLRRFGMTVTDLGD